MEASIIGPGHVTVHDEVSYSLDNGLGISYTWKLKGGIILEGQDTPVVNVKWLEPGHKEITVEVVYHDHRTEQISKIVVVDPNPSEH